jgi:hypothetical protein
VDTPPSVSVAEDRLEERRRELRSTLPIGRLIGPADVATLAVPIMADTASTGTTRDVDAVGPDT